MNRMQLNLTSFGDPVYEDIVVRSSHYLPLDKVAVTNHYRSNKRMAYIHLKVQHAPVLGSQSAYR